MAHVHLGQAQEGQRLEHLARKLADEHEAHALELGAPQQVVQVEGHVLKHQARVAIVVKVLQEAHCGVVRAGGREVGGREGVSKLE